MKKLPVLLLLIFVVIAMSGLYSYVSLQGVCQKNCTPQVFVVPQGASLNEVLASLEKEKIIRNSFIAKAYLKLKKFNANIQAGDFKLNPKDNLDKIIATLQKGTLDFWLTIPEGYRAEQVYEKILTNTNKKNTRDVEIYKQNEGYLFPDTYLIPKNASDENVVKILKNNFNVKIDSIVDPTKIKIANKDEITLQNLIILASLVEREAKNESERPIIANIIYKRWKAGWPLQVDATIQYAVGKSGEWWKKDLALEDLKVVSLYNTYTNRGLPPAPICNPGIKAISAVVSQAQTDYWFYSTGKDGVTRYAKTLQEHNANVGKYVN